MFLHDCLPKAKSRSKLLRVKGVGWCCAFDRWVTLYPTCAFECSTARYQEKRRGGSEGSATASTWPCKWITVLFDRCLVSLSVWEVRYKVKLAAACQRSVPTPYVHPSFDPTAPRCPFGDLACFIMQITLHLPDWPCARGCVCLRW